ncbi:Coenzyme F420 hydrogenase/dehydrogenase, beta subunit C-terminal domain [Helicobacter equorum]|uniref:Coenzyme F420 hydrogenase/dehydrogenase, beta subunit C-terminal domain n=1 Tax=Helicobacter equorum TaxID=361872 RepID=UPI000CF07BBD|nr:Coenzyme F420 hydrogenase/dehydrogenase, beta subunit C-terminal domain [Helicobacter equorum]
MDSTHVVSNTDSKRHYFAFKAKDTQLRLNSSSGGIFSLLAESIIKQGGVVFGVGYDENLRVVHKGIETIDELDSIRRSKYVQSDKGESFRQVKELLKNGRKILFSGVQCEIQGLLAYLKKPYANLLTCEVICNSVPSPKVWEIYKESLLEEEGEKLIDFNFRGKDYGWKKGIFAVKTKTIPHYESDFMRGFLEHVITRPSCENCYAKDGQSGSDITLGDFWGLERSHPEFSDDVGVSCVITHNTKALQAIESLKDFGEWEYSSYESIAYGNRALFVSGHTNPVRKQALHEIIHTYSTQGAKEAMHILRKYLKSNVNKSWYLRALRQKIVTCMPYSLKTTLKRIFKKTGGRDITIVTFIDTTNNYGQVMQAYALHQYLHKTYPKVNISFADIGDIRVPFVRRIWRALKKYGIFGFIQEFFIRFNARLSKKDIDSANLNFCVLDTRRAFDVFRANFMYKSDKTFGNLYFRNIPKSDIYIAGSDQIWNSYWGVTRENFCVNPLYHYMLGFVDKKKPHFRNVKKIAYAPSIGSPDIAQDLQDLYYQYLSSFDVLSVREECNISSLKTLGLHAVCARSYHVAFSRGLLIDSYKIKG